MTAPESDTPSPLRGQTITRRLLAIVATLLGLGALMVAEPVLLPLTFAVFLVALFWPLQRRLEGRLPRAAALGVTLLTFVVVLALFAGALWWSGEIVARQAATYEQEFQALAETWRQRAQAVGIDLPGGTDTGATGSASGRLFDLAGRVATFGGMTVLVAAFFVLGLLEVRSFRMKLDRALSHEAGPRWIDPAHRIARDFQRYIVVRTAVGLITGTAVGLFCWAFGLDFAFVWGMINFLLNYIPTLGSLAAIVPPTLFALVQYDGLLNPALVLLGVGGLQLLMGNYIDPLLQGRYLHLSPLVVLLSVTFWGWLWGIAGAFISVPITVAVVITCDQFQRTRWIAVLLADLGDPDERADQAAHAPEGG